MSVAQFGFLQLCSRFCIWELWLPRLSLSFKILLCLFGVFWPHESTWIWRNLDCFVKLSNLLMWSTFSFIQFLKFLSAMFLKFSSYKSFTPSLNSFLSIFSFAGFSLLLYGNAKLCVCVNLRVEFFQVPDLICWISVFSILLIFTLIYIFFLLSVLHLVYATLSSSLR